jgi:hypothetical protein
MSRFSRIEESILCHFILRKEFDYLGFFYPFQDENEAKKSLKKGGGISEIFNLKLKILP